MNIIIKLESTSQILSKYFPNVLFTLRVLVLRDCYIFEMKLFLVRKSQYICSKQTYVSGLSRLIDHDDHGTLKNMPSENTTKKNSIIL